MEYWPVRMGCLRPSAVGAGSIMQAGVAALAVFYVMFGCLSFVEMAYLPRYLAALGIHKENIGLILGSVTLARVVAAPLWAKMAEDRQANALVVRRQATVALVVLGLLPFVSSHLGVALLIFLTGTGHGTVMPIADILTIQTVGLARFGQIRSAASIGYGVMALGAALLGGAWSHEGISRIAPYVLAVTAAGLFVSARFLPENVSTVAEQEKVSWKERWEVLTGRALWPLFILCMFHWMSVVPYNAFLVFLCEDRGIGASVPGLAVGWGIFCEVLLFLGGARLVARWGAPRVLVASAIITTLRWVLTVWWKGAVPLILVQGLHGVTVATFQIAAMSLLFSRVGPSMRTTAQAVFHMMVFGAGGGLGMVLAGQVLAAGGPEQLFVGAAWLELVVTVGILWWVWPRAQASHPASGIPLEG